MNKNFKICYLAPQLTALESTFVYEELIALECRGLTIVPMSVSRANKQVEGHENLVLRTLYLYEDKPLKTLLSSIGAVLRMKYNHKHGLQQLFSDIWLVGLFGRQSYKLIYQYIVACRLAEVLVGQNCHHLHVHFAHVPTQIGMYASALSSVPFTIMAHANDIFERGLLLERKASRAVKMLTISEFNLNYLESLGVPKSKLAVVRCGVSFPTFQKVYQRQRKTSYRIGTLARLVEKKGIDDLLYALAELQNHSCQIVLSIAGDGPLRKELGSLVQKLGLLKFVSFEGSLDRREVTAWIRNLDVFVLACKKDSNGDMDGIPVVLMEAMSQSVPVISTNLSGIPELIIHGKTGLLSEPSNPKDLSEKIRRLIDSPNLCVKLVNNAKNHVVDEFGQEVNVDRLLKYFDLPNSL